MVYGSSQYSDEDALGPGGATGGEYMRQDRSRAGTVDEDDGQDSDSRTPSRLDSVQSNGMTGSEQLKRELDEAEFDQEGKYKSVVAELYPGHICPDSLSDETDYSINSSYSTLSLTDLE